MCEEPELIYFLFSGSSHISMSCGAEGQSCSDLDGQTAWIGSSQSVSGWEDSPLGQEEGWHPFQSRYGTYQALKAQKKWVPLGGADTSEGVWKSGDP